MIQNNPFASSKDQTGFKYTLKNSVKKTIVCEFIKNPKR